MSVVVVSFSCSWSAAGCGPSNAELLVSHFLPLGASVFQVSDLDQARTRSTRLLKCATASQFREALREAVRSSERRLLLYAGGERGDGLLLPDGSLVPPRTLIRMVGDSLLEGSQLLLLSEGLKADLFGLPFRFSLPEERLLLSSQPSFSHDIVNFSFQPLSIESHESSEGTSGLRAFLSAVGSSVRYDYGSLLSRARKVIGDISGQQEDLEVRCSLPADCVMWSWLRDRLHFVRIDEESSTLLVTMEEP